MEYDPLLIRYQNDVYFHNLVNHIRQAACQAQQTEAVWRDAVQLAFELERRRGSEKHLASVVEGDAMAASIRQQIEGGV